MTRAPSHFIKAMHPKTEIRPDPGTIRRILDKGWWGQVKIQGHRAQFHISSDPSQPILAYNRQGRLHSIPVPEALAADLRRIFAPRDGWNAIDAEWVKSANRVYVFDMLKFKGKILVNTTYEERFASIPRIYQSDLIETLPVLTTVEQCMRVLENPGLRVEGIVLKARNTPGFADTSIIRCRIQRP